jgi:hypothetical protein
VAIFDANHLNAAQFDLGASTLTGADWMRLPEGKRVITIPGASQAEQDAIQAFLANPPPVVVADPATARLTDDYLACLAAFNSIPSAPPAPAPDPWAATRARVKACLDSCCITMEAAGGPV